MLSYSKLNGSLTHFSELFVWQIAPICSINHRHCSTRSATSLPNEVGDVNQNSFVFSFSLWSSDKTSRVVWSETKQARRKKLKTFLHKGVNNNNRTMISTIIIKFTHWQHQSSRETFGEEKTTADQFFRHRDGLTNISMTLSVSRAQIKSLLSAVICRSSKFIVFQWKVN